MRHACGVCILNMKPHGLRSAPTACHLLSSEAPAFLVEGERERTLEQQARSQVPSRYRWVRRQQGACLPPPQLDSPPSCHRALKVTAPPSPCPLGASVCVQTLTSNLSPGQHPVPLTAHSCHNREESFQAIIDGISQRPNLTDISLVRYCLSSAPQYPTARFLRCMAS